MRDFAAVFAYEVSQRRLAPVVAVCLGVLPWLLPLLRPGSRPDDLRAVSAGLLSLLLGWGLALLLGGSVVASDLKNDRLGFLFAQPVRGTAIWAGKLAAATALATACAALVLLPTALFDPPAAPSRILALALALSFPALVLVGHVLAVSWHGRNAWLGLDVGALAIAALVAFVALRRLIEASAHLMAWIGAAAAVGLLALGTAGATCLQVSRGRASLARANRFLSIGMATALAFTALGLWLYADWSLRPEHRDLLGVRYARAHGDWIEVAGAFRGRPGYHPAVLIHRRTGAMLHLPGYPEAFRVSWRTDGNVRGLVWLTGSPSSRGSTLWRVDLTAERPRALETGVQAPGQPFFLALSPDADRAAILSVNPAQYSDVRLSVHELPSGRVLAVRRVPEDMVFAEGSLLVFDGDDRLLLVTPECDGPCGVTRIHFDVTAGRFDEPFRIPGLRLRDVSALWTSADGQLVRAYGVAYSTRTGETLVASESPDRLGLLQGGRAATLSSSEDRRTWVLSVVSSAERLETTLPDLGYPHLLCEHAGGLVVAMVPPYEPRPAKHYATSYWWVQTETGFVRRLGETWRLVGPGGSASLFAVDRDGALHEIDPASDVTTVVVTGGLPPDHDWDRDWSARHLLDRYLPRDPMQFSRPPPLSHIGLAGRY